MSNATYFHPLKRSLAYSILSRKRVAPDRIVHVFFPEISVNFRFVGSRNSNFPNPKDLFLCFYSVNVICNISTFFSKIRIFLIFIVMSDDPFDIDHVTQTFNLCNCHFLMLAQIPSAPHRRGWKFVLEI